MKQPINLNWWQKLLQVMTITVILVWLMFLIMLGVSFIWNL